MLALPPPHRWKLFFMGFLHRSFRRSTSLSDPPLDPLFSSFACSSPDRFSSPIRLHPCFSLFLFLPHLFAAPSCKLTKEKREGGRIEGMRRPVFLLISSSKTKENVRDGKNDQQNGIPSSLWSVWENREINQNALL